MQEEDDDLREQAELIKQGIPEMLEDLHRRTGRSYEEIRDESREMARHFEEEAERIIGQRTIN